MHSMMFTAGRVLGRMARGVAGACVALCAGLAWAQAGGYPDRPVRVVVPYPPGGPTDIVARVLFQQIAESTGKQFLVDNRAGAGGNIGAEAVARAAADGYTVLIGTTAHAINMSLFKGLNYDVRKDFAPVSLLTQGPLVLVAHPQFAANSVRELLDLIRARPGTVSFASSGNGQSTHLAAELFDTLAGVRMTHVPYKGSAPALADVMSGQVSVMFDTSLSAMPFVRAGKLKALGVTSAARTPAAPGVPTIAESGLPGYEVFAWNGALVPAGTPQFAIQWLNEEIRKAMHLPQVSERFNAQGFAASWSTPEQFGDFLRGEVDKWARTVKAAGAKVD